MVGIVLRDGRPTRWGWIAILATFLLAALATGYALHRGLQEARPLSTRPIAATGESVPVQPIQSREFVTWRDESGSIHRARVDRQRVARFLRERHAAAATARAEAHARVRGLLSAELEPIFAGVAERVPSYADWYFSFSTQYVLMGHALASTVRYTLATPLISLGLRERPTQSVVDHMNEYLRVQYSNRVLRPRETEAAIQSALHRTLATLRADWTSHVVAQREAMRAFVLAEIQPGQRLPGDDAGRPAFDWDAQGLGHGLEPASQHTATHRFRQGLLDIVFEVPHYAGLEDADPREHEGAEEGSEEVAHVIVDLFGWGALAIGFAAGVIVSGATVIPPSAAMIIGLGATFGAEMLSSRLEESLTRPQFEHGLRQSIETTRESIEVAMIAVFDRHIDRWIDTMDRHIAAE
jgi:hypothetical protein